MIAVFRSIPIQLEDAAMNLGAWLTQTFVSVSFPFQTGCRGERPSRVPLLPE
jgi:ABC-type sulfate transport system permease component